MIFMICKSLLARLQCNNCKTHLLLDPTDRHALKMPVYPWYAKFAEFKQKGGLIFPSLPVIMIVKVTEVIFRNIIIDKGIGITIERNLGLTIQNAVFKSIGNGIFGDSSHYYDHIIGETDHLSTLVKMVTKRYLDVRMSTYGKNYSEMVVHQNLPSNRHHLTRTILFSNI